MGYRNKDSITLHPKYGVNATVPQCFWCGQDKNEVALLGAGYKGEAPRTMVIDYDPCAACEDRWAQGVVVIEATHEPNGQGQQPAVGSIYPTPTGRYFVVTEEAVDKLFQPDKVREKVRRHRKAWLEPEAFNKLCELLRKPE